MNYYNEHDPKAAAWLRELIKANLIPAGQVDERSISDVTASDLRGFIQCHFFAGIGGWSYALQLAGWPADRPVWTGSCPCQPFSSAGKGLGTADERHLWPVFFNLIRECRPVVVFGEQVASAIGHGWLDGVSADLEQEGYACGAAVLGAHSSGAPHPRQRLYWVADAMQPGRSERWTVAGSGQTAGGCGTGGLADASSAGPQGNMPGCGGVGVAVESSEQEQQFERYGYAGGLGDTMREGRTRQPFGQLGASNQGSWSDFDLLHCLDGKTRRVESGTFPLAHGVPARVVRLRGYGNAIVPQVAAEFVQAFQETRHHLTA